MKIILRPNLKIIESTSGGMFVDTVANWQLKLDAHEMMLWRFIVLGMTTWPPVPGREQRPVSPGDPITEQAEALLNRLVVYGFVSISDAGDAAAPPGAAERAKGVWNRFREWLGWRLDARFDRRFGTDTGERVKVADMGVTSPSAEFAVYYEATPTRVFRKALRLAVPDARGFVFVDYGSGKGRTLLLASDLPFRRVIGIELSGQLHLTAQHNLRRYRDGRHRCPDVTSICGDATRFELPEGDLAIYFYTPFIGPVFDRVLERIGAAVAQSPRRLIVFTYNSRVDQIDRLKAQPYLTRHREFNLGFEPTRLRQRPLHVFGNH